MPRYIVKPDLAEDFYVEWSTIVEEPISWGPRLFMEVDAGIELDRLDRADVQGNSYRTGQEYVGDGEIYKQLGYLPFSRMRAFCDALEVSILPEGQEHRDATVWSLLDPLD